MQVDLFNQSGEVIDKVELADRIFGVKLNPELVKQVIDAQRANARQVLAHTKGRGEVRGGGIKPWRQKGTGRARHGSRRSPIWKGGGVTFGPTKERNFSKDINKKMKQKALFMTLSSKLKDFQMAVLDTLKLEQQRTKEAAAVMSNADKWFKDYNMGSKPRRQGVGVQTKASGKRDKILTVVAGKDKMLEKSFSNLPYIELFEARNINPYDVLKYKYLLLTKDALPVIEKTFKN